jgi:sodium transport system permease protein
MSTVLAIFRKELIDTLRDRRTIVTMIIIPFLAFPLIMGFVVKLTFSQVKKAEARRVPIALVTNGNAESLRELAVARADLDVREDVPESEIRPRIETKEIEGALVVAPGFDERVQELRPGGLTIYYRSTEELDVAERRLKDLVEEYREKLVAERFARLQLDESLNEPVETTEVNLASLREIVGGKVGGFIPYLFILFCFMGSMYPAIDLGAGEKERGTLETLLTSPASFGEILTGKFGVLTLSGLTSAALSVLGLYIAVQTVPEIPDDAFRVIMSLLGTRSIILLLTLLLPLTVFFSAVQLALSFMAKSFKEAQSVITPLSFLIIVPAIMGTIPGFEFNMRTAWIPVVNVSLASKSILAGTIETTPLVVAYVTLVALAVASLAVAARWIGREETMFRS